MIKKLGIFLLALIAVVGLSSAVSAQPIAGPNYGPNYGSNYGHYMGHGGHNTIIIINRNRHHYFPPFYRFHYRHHYFPPFYRFHYRNHFYPMYRR